MRWGKRIAVVIPAYNEERLIGQTLGTLPRWVDDVIVVDDGSTDGTASVCRNSERPVTLLRHAHNQGVGSALLRGYREAFSRGNQIAAVMGADGQMDPDDLAEVVRPVAERRADYCKGNRLAHGDCTREMPSLRRLAAHVLSFATGVLTGLPIQDSQCGFTALDRKAAEQLDLETLWPRYGYPNDLLVRVAKRALRLEQVRIRPIYQTEESGLRWWHGLFVVPYVLLRAWWTFPACSTGSAKQLRSGPRTRANSAL